MIEFLPAIPADLPLAEFAQTLQQRIEAASGRLIAEALATDPSLAANLAKKEKSAPGDVLTSIFICSYFVCVTFLN